MGTLLTQRRGKNPNSSIHGYGFHEGQIWKQVDKLRKDNNTLQVKVGYREKINACIAPQIEN